MCLNFVVAAIVLGTCLATSLVALTVVAIKLCILPKISRASKTEKRAITSTSPARPDYPTRSYSVKSDTVVLPDDVSSYHEYSYAILPPQSQNGSRNHNNVNDHLSTIRSQLHQSNPHVENGADYLTPTIESDYARDAIEDEYVGPEP